MVTIAVVVDIFFYHVIISRRSFVDDSYRRLVAKYQERKAAQMVRWLIPWLKKARQESLRRKRLARAGAQSCSKKRWR